MTDQHPLTDSYLQSYFKYGDGPYDEDQMRDVADWQLEQVIDWIEENGHEYVYYHYELGCQSEFNRMTADLRKAMRQQENN